MGMSVGEEKSVTIEPNDAYGQRNEAYVKELPKNPFRKMLTSKKA